MALAALLAVATACTPEAGRERGVGRGADIGNRGWPIRMHGDVDPVRRIYHETPLTGQGIERTGGAGGIQPQP